jgi:hypothetical protein
MEKYKAQLEQVNASISKSPDNVNLLSLKDKLEAIIELQTPNISKKQKNPNPEKVGFGTEFPLQIGEACEIFDEKENYWKLGNIISMTIDRSFYIVAIEKTKITVRAPSTQIRRPLHREKKKVNQASSKMVQKPTSNLKVRKVQPDPEGTNQWKKFSEKMNKK